jgi:hypothetical protein
VAEPSKETVAKKSSKVEAEPTAEVADKPKKAAVKKAPAKKTATKKATTKKTTKTKKEA